MRPCQRTKKVVELEGEGDINCKWEAKNGAQRFGKMTGGVGNQRTNRDNSDYSIIDISLNIKESPKDPKETLCHLDSSESLPQNLHHKHSTNTCAIKKLIKKLILRYRQKHFFHFKQTIIPVRSDSRQPLKIFMTAKVKVRQMCDQRLKIRSVVYLTQRKMCVMFVCVIER